MLLQHTYIYEGGEVDNDKLIVDLSGSSAKFDPIVSNSADGKITIKYVGKEATRVRTSLSKCKAIRRKPSR